MTKFIITVKYSATVHDEFGEFVGNDCIQFQTFNTLDEVYTTFMNKIADPLYCPQDSGCREEDVKIINITCQKITDIDFSEEDELLIKELKQYMLESKKKQIEEKKRQELETKQHYKIMKYKNELALLKKLQKKYPKGR